MARKPPSLPKTDYKNCTVLGPPIARYVNGKKYWYVRLRCKRCGKEREIILVTSQFPEDGPVCRDCSKPTLVHGMHGTRTHSAWERMWHRVKNDPHYIAMGTKVEDPDWKTFPGFLKDMKLIPDDKESLERVDNNRGYGKIRMPDGKIVLNCIWANRVEQNNNTSRNVKIDVDGESMTVAQAVERFEISYPALYKSIFERGEDADEAVSRLVDAKNAVPPLSEIATEAGVDYECLRRQVMRGSRTIADAIIYLQDKLAAGTRAAAARELGVPVHLLRSRMDRGMTLSQAIEDVRATLL